MSEIETDCPRCVVDHVRKRLEEWRSTTRQGRRSWYQKWIECTEQTEPPHAAEVVQLSDCIPSDKLCEGEVLWIWCVDSSMVMAINDRTVAPDDNSFLAATVPIPTFILCISGDEKECVLIEIDVDGNRTRRAFALPAGKRSEVLGAQIGQSVVDRVSRKHVWHPVHRMLLYLRGCPTGEL